MIKYIKLLKALFSTKGLLIIMKIKNFLILILAVAAVFCVAACGADRNDGEEKDDTQVAAGAYIVSVDTTKVAVDADSMVSVSIRWTERS